MPLTSLAEAKAYMGVTTIEHDVEITRLVSQADDVVQEWAGPTAIRATYVDEVTVRGPLLLPRYPVVSVTSVETFNGTGFTTDTTPAAVFDGNVTTTYRYGSRLRITYVAGLAAIPAAYVDAALVWISYKYRRNHGGSETYMPSGVDGSISPPMGTRAVRDQIVAALGPYARGPVIA